jgi:superfamily I DNA and RNA helicase
MEYLAGNIETENNPFELHIWEVLIEYFDAYEGILGYKIPSLGFLTNEIPSFILRSQSIGIVIVDVISDKITAFDTENEYWTTNTGDEIYSRDLSLNIYARELDSVLKKHSRLFNIRTDKWLENIQITKFLLFANNSEFEINQLISSTENPLISKFITSENISEKLSDLIIRTPQDLSESTIDIIDSILDGSDVFSKIKKKKILEAPKTLNEFIKKSLDYTFKLDKTQRQVALQVPPGPQRIRGLAGTGKTVILCMKAALAHKALKDQKILFVFNTQSMYNQVRSTITEYYFNLSKSMPNWSNLHILHAWGGSSMPGVYYNTANAAGVKPLNYMNVKHHSNPLEAIYANLIETAKDKIIPTYDIVLIDEAQDFSPAFFETIYYLTKPIDSDLTKRRIVWAYDEFQSLSELTIAQPVDLFGLKKDGSPNMPNSVLEGTYKGKIKKDFVLPNSYRNPRINLMVAHGLALGLYSTYAKVPMEDRTDWIARGYKVLEPAKQIFVEGDSVIVERPEENSKNELERLLKESGATEKKLVHFKKFANIGSELNDVIINVERLINQQNVEPEEIIIINLDTKSSKEQFEVIRQQLDIKKIKSITPGFIEATDAFKEPGNVTLSTAFRAKGNEANIVL